MKRALFVCFLSLGWPSLLFADQCAWISPDEGTKAEELLAQQAEILLYCELCDGDKPNIVRIESVRINKVEGGKYREVYVNGNPVDLAYAFLPDMNNAGKYQNISKLVGCESSGVSSVLTYPLEANKSEDVTGRYKKGSVAWEVTGQRGLIHQVVVEFSSEINGSDRGRLESTSSLEDNKLVVTTPLEGCKFVLEPKAKTLKVLPTKVCGKFGLFLSGDFQK